MSTPHFRTRSVGICFVAIFVATILYPTAVHLFAGDSFGTYGLDTSTTESSPSGRKVQGRETPRGEVSRQRSPLESPPQEQAYRKEGGNKDASRSERGDTLNARQTINFGSIDYPLLHAEILRHTNIRREAHGLPPLQHNQALEDAARNHSVDMRNGGFMSHTSPIPGRTTVPDRTAEAGFQGNGVGENIAISFGIQYTAGRGVYNPGQNGGYFSYEYQGDPIPVHTYSSAAEAVVEQWMNSPGHRENILRERYRYMGAGAAYFADSDFYGMPKFYYAQVFGM